MSRVEQKPKKPSKKELARQAHAAKVKHIKTRWAAMTGVQRMDVLRESGAEPDLMIERSSTFGHAQTPLLFAPAWDARFVRWVASMTWLHIRKRASPEVGSALLARLGDPA